MLRLFELPAQNNVQLNIEDRAKNCSVQKEFCDLYTIRR